MAVTDDIQRAFADLLGRNALHNPLNDYQVDSDVSKLVGVVNYLTTQLRLECSDQSQTNIILENVLAMLVKK